MFCIVPMQTLRQGPYNLILGMTIIAKVEAKNIIGYSPPSDENVEFAELRTEPLSPIN